MNLHWPARIQLQSQLTAQCPFEICHFDRFVTIDPNLDMMAHRFNLVRVPITELHKFFARFFLEQAAAMSFVEFAPPAHTDISLVTAHQSIRDRLAAKLDTAVADVINQLYFELEMEGSRRQIAPRL